MPVRRLEAHPIGLQSDVPFGRAGWPNTPSARPTPSSATINSARSPRKERRRSTRLALACFTTFVTSSRADVNSSMSIGVRVSAGQSSTSREAARPARGAAAASRLSNACGKPDCSSTAGCSSVTVLRSNSRRLGQCPVKTVQRIAGISSRRSSRSSRAPRMYCSAPSCRCSAEAAPLTLLDAHQLSQQARSVRRELTYRQHAGALDRGEPHGSGR